MLLVKYTGICGEYELYCHTVLEGSVDKTDEESVHDYFLYFSDGTKIIEKAEEYTYQDGMIGVKEIAWFPLEDDDYEVLKRLGLDG